MNDVVAVPALRYDEREWAPRHPEIFSRAEVVRQTGPYSSALTAPIEEWTPDLPAALAADIAEAEAALRVFDAHNITKLGASSAELGPMSAILLRTESSSSSQIEQLTASARALAYAELDETDKRNALTVVGNVRAMEAAVELADQLSTESVLAMHRELMRDTMPPHAGRFREELVWIGGADTAGPRGATFIAPQHELVPAAVDDVLRFAHRADLPALLQIAVAHAQFETIHPFVDGNGRTGRALAHAMLRVTGLARHTTVPLSAGILRDTHAYFDALGRFREGDAEPIIRTFANAARYAAVSGTALVDDLHAQLESDGAKLAGVRADSRARQALPILVGQPAVNTRYLQRKLGASASATIRTLDTLASHGVIVERSGLKRNRVWEHRGVLAILDAYAAAIRRAG